jgi:hypothetical protein
MYRYRDTGIKTKAGIGSPLKNRDTNINYNNNNDLPIKDRGSGGFCRTLDTGQLQIKYR